jgi:hypothetical protein
MACFLVPGTEVIVTTVIQKVIEHKEKKAAGEKAEKNGLTWSRKLGWLNKMLWGGTILLGLEHVWHGEVTPWPPFLTAMGNPANIAPMLHEIATVGVAMAIAVTGVWGIMIWVAESKNRKNSEIGEVLAGREEKCG